jgi:hypothetical protein
MLFWIMRKSSIKLIDIDPSKNDFQMFFTNVSNNCTVQCLHLGRKIGIDTEQFGTAEM